MKGYVPSKLSLNLEIAKDGENKLIFKEWHERISDEEFEKINEQTKISVNTMLEQYAPLGLNVKFTPYETEKGYEVIYTGKNIRPAICAIFGELMPLLVTNEKEAVQTINLMMQIVNFCLKHEIIQP